MLGLEWNIKESASRRRFRRREGIPEEKSGKVADG